uniref:Putative formyltetrahydrofolate dehydrogenase n=1 Tax=Rhipicephalus microplus TaxID=6941 RepID=A0A6M2CIV4_RHIMP
MFAKTMRCGKRSLYVEPHNFIAGKKVATTDPIGEIKVLQPATGKVLCHVPCSGPKDVDKAVSAAKQAFDQWSALSHGERGKFLTAVAKKVRERHQEIAEVEMTDTGKPIWEALVDIDGCADALEYYGGIAASIKGQQFDLPGGSFAMVRREPLGVVAAIGAWNYPFQVMSWKMAPALACGNTFVFKPSPLTPLSAILLSEICHDVGLPDGVVNLVQGEGKTGELLCDHPDVAKVSFTGSVPTGQAIMRRCADSMKRCTLELGGKSPLIVFADASPAEAVKATLLGNFLTQGEVCSNCTRVFVEKPMVEEFLDHLVKATKKLKIGDPADPDTTVGATISAEHAARVLSYVDSARKEGARVLCGGKRVTPSNPELSGGFYLSPCVLADCTDSMKVMQEEVFGAVVSISAFDTEEEALRRANNSPFGLAAGVMTNDLKRAHRVANKLQAGIVWINNYNVFPSEVPFGGYKMSGYGRENGLAALQAYSQEKTIYVEMGDGVNCPLYKL